MPLQEKIFRFFSFGALSGKSAVNPNRVILLNLITSLASLMLLISGIASFAQGLALPAWVLTASGVLGLTALGFYNRFYKHKIAEHFLITLSTLILIFLTISGGPGGMGTIWALVFPVITLIMLGLKRGSIFSLGLLVVILVLVFGDFNFVSPDYSTGFGLRFAGAYACIHILTYSFEYLRISNIREMDKALEDAETETRSRDEFISRLSHSLRTSLNNITLVSNIVSELDLDDSQKDLIDTIIASTNNLVEAVNNIVDITHSDPEGLKGNQIPFNIYSTIDSIINLFSAGEDGSIDIALKRDPSITGRLMGDPIRVKQLFLNLIETIKKTGAGGTPTRVEILIINERETDKEMSLSFRCTVEPAGSRAHETGSGTDGCLGEGSAFDHADLTIPTRLVESQGGTLELVQEDNACVFTFNLTFEKGRAPGAPEDQKEIENLMATRKVKLKEANILLVEDNQINQKIVTLSLEKHVRNIDIALNGKEALDKFGTSNYDLILMDIQMPVMDGILATKKIREIESSTNSFTPIIAITANAMSGDRETCLAVGMDDYISKPFQFNILIGKMKYLLERDSTRKDEPSGKA